ncbi:PREDICTED: APO protein 3, mitochondrial isoform X1 [Theobroma cacao]|uniref:APO protein 3, mitochondrial isoform X1 n=2 Tax=Theobroma cacao TaxID=3641 RepID=A0AB32W0I8_THECC|nr:PREDICTED: APO protein 3, mitochondrial isoform X1 [Theobroma cacao]XP_017971607.1 PREDICTED: APO protein 3, mitochondrial isoform X1 [Theobroma cacao]
MFDAIVLLFFFWIFGHLAFLSDIACIMFVKITKMEKKKKILSTAMLPRQAQTIKKLWEFATQNSSTFSIVGNKLKHQCGSYSTGQTCRELPRKLKKAERKPWVTNINELKRIARTERKERQMVRERILQPPENGLLVKELIPVAHQVYDARTKLLACVLKVAEGIAIYSCSVCGEVHIGNPPHKIRTCNVMGSAASKEHSWKRGAVEHILPLVESFHLYDRLGRAVSHNERLQVDRIPAILELCVQAGINFSEYPTRRRVFPAYSISGRIIDFERRFPKEDAPGKDINSCGFWQKRNKTSGDSKFVDLQPGDLQGIAVCGMEAWKRMHSGASRLMQKYAVQTCGYCLEVQVGPKGHRVRNCQAYKQQMRDGQHAWQEATIDDVIPPVYVWHIQNHQSGKPLVNELKRYYGMLPAVVELFAQAGASVPDDYAGMMREDVAVPELDEEMLVV